MMISIKVLLNPRTILLISMRTVPIHINHTIIPQMIKIKSIKTTTMVLDQTMCRIMGSIMWLNRLMESIVSLCYKMIKI